MDLDARLRKGPLRVRALWDAEQSAALPERVLARRRRRLATRAGAVALAGVAAATTLAVLEGETRLSPPPGGAAASSPAAATAPGDGAQPAARSVSHSPRERALVLSDGSRVELGEATEVSLERDSPREARAILHAGEAAFAVVPNAERVFELRAGPVRVRVLGTRFAVQLRDARARVAVQEGAVQVRWGDAAARVLAAGEAQWFPPADAALNDKPLEPRNQPADLMLAADVARRSGHHREAVAPLRQVLTRHADDARAPLAAFTLGRVLAEELGQHAAAGDAFAAARRLSPGGALAADALAREIEAREQAGQATRARALAERYLELYPGGRHGRRYERLRSTD